jgi:hypothetical protein
MRYATAAALGLLLCSLLVVPSVDWAACCFSSAASLESWLGVVFGSTVPGSSIGTGQAWYGWSGVAGLMVGVGFGSWGLLGVDILRSVILLATTLRICAEGEVAGHGCLLLAAALLGSHTQLPLCTGPYLCV